jgi:hypothetical protein
MPLSVAQYLRHLAVRCSRLSHDCYDSRVAAELESISVELVEKAEYMEGLLRMGCESTGAQDDDEAKIVCSDDDEAT